MDHRILLTPGTRLAFPGMNCVVDAFVGKGSNAVVYEGFYCDSLSQTRHRVLIKELFPYAPRDQIYRNERGAICHTGDAAMTWELHRQSFERGNEVHLNMLRINPDAVGGNLNTFELNDTLYSVLEYSGGRSIDQEIKPEKPPDLRVTINRMTRLLDVLNVFHENGYLHLDISPDNILLIGSGNLERVSLIDFNSIHTYDELKDGLDIYFSEKEGFTAPEVRNRSHRKIGRWTDLYAVASVFFSCLTGRTLSYEELNEKSAPTAEESPLLSDIPVTARAQARKILQRGLCILTKKRYQTCDEMRGDFEELLRRIDLRGVTHAALWEAGKKNAARLIKQNPSLSYVADEKELYPLSVMTEDERAVPGAQWIREMAEQGKSFLLLGEGGIGKSTLLMRTALTVPDQYHESDTAVLYVPLMPWKEGTRNFILDSILMGLRFDARTSTMDAARQALYQMLSDPPVQKNGKTGGVLILLDGFNEARGDTAELIDEINRLSALPGACVAVSGRTAEEKLLLPRFQMTRLDEETVRRALSEHGLLAPEEAGMLEFLRVPMMLSMYLSTARHEETQVQCRTGRELLERYLHALCAHGIETEENRCRTEAAVWLVLPAIAGETDKKKHALNDTEMQQVVGQCYQILRSRGLTKAFPQWIGHKDEILMENADAWYGRIVHRILWKQLGLLTMENGEYHLPHQIIQEYLLSVCADNERKLKDRRVKRAAAAAIALTLLLVSLTCAYNTWIRKTPYSEAYSKAVFERASLHYANAMRNARWLYDYLHGNPDASARGPEVFQISGTVKLYLNALEEEHAQGASALPWTVGFFPWQTGSSFSLTDCRTLLSLPESQTKHYPDIIRGWKALEENADPLLKEQYLAAVDRYLIAQQDYARGLNDLVCTPYEAGYPDARNYGTGVSTVAGDLIGGMEHEGPRQDSNAISHYSQVDSAARECGDAWDDLAGFLGKMEITVTLGD